MYGFNMRKNSQHVQRTGGKNKASDNNSCDLFQGIISLLIIWRFIQKFVEYVSLQYQAHSGNIDL